MRRFHDTRRLVLALGWSCLLAALCACGEDVSPPSTSGTTVDTPANDATTDLSFLPDLPSDLGANCVDEDGDGRGEGCTLGFDCNDTSRLIYEGAEERCDNVDNNCDGTIDEDCPCSDGSIQSCYTGPPGTLSIGRCRSGWQVCADAEWGACQAELHPAEEICDGLDNDCNGLVDEELTNACGLCGTTPEEVCGDGLDNDCDGTIDETEAGCDCDDRTGQTCYSGPPQTLGVGQCHGGFFDCGEDGEWGPCLDQMLPDDESCDGLDNDCDGLIDEQLTNQCGVCGAPNPREVCDGEDNDCDGLIDEGLVLVCGLCSAEGLEEVCGDGLDNDCDGDVDEGCACIGEPACYPGPAEVRGIGACVEGTRDCDSSGEFWGACTGYMLPQPEICDGEDNDCDGEIDISPLGCSLCDRNIEECDRIDNDCDGMVDEYLRNSCDQCLDEITPEEDCGQDCCDNVDNDCDGLIDEFLLNACGTCGDTCYVVINEPTDSDEIGEGGDLIEADDPANPTGRPGITLSKQTYIPPFLWVANHEDDTATRFNIETLQEEGRYWVGDNPSRTAVDLDGNVWIGARGNGYLTKILWDIETCPDRNENGTIETSRPGALGPLNSAADPYADECVVYSEVQARNVVRGVAAGPDGRVWFGFSDYNGGVQSIDSHTFELSELYDGAVVPEYAPGPDGVQQPVLNPDGSPVTSRQGGVYGLVVDSAGYLYTSSTGRRNTLSRFDTNTNTWDAIFTQYQCGSYGIAVDGQNRIWTGGYNNCDGIGMFDPATMRFHSFAVPRGFTITHGGTTVVDSDPPAGCGTHPYPNYCVTGVAAEPATGNIWASFYNAGYTGRLTVDEDNLANSSWRFIGTPYEDYAGTLYEGVSKDLRGIGFDAQGFAWTLGLGSGRVWMLDPATNARAAALPDGRTVGVKTHYTYSDFTGSTVLSFTAPRTTWTYTFASNYPNAQIDFVTWEAFVPDGTTAGLRIRALDAEGDPRTEWLPPPAGDGTAQFHAYPSGVDEDTFELGPLGLVGYAFQVEVRLTTNDPDALPIVHRVALHWQRP